MTHFSKIAFVFEFFYLRVALRSISISLYNIMIFDVTRSGSRLVDISAFYCLLL